MLDWATSQNGERALVALGFKTMTKQFLGLVPVTFGKSSILFFSRRSAASA